jgi:hypothetical protein
MFHDAFRRKRCLIPVSKTSSILIVRGNHLTSAHDDRAAIFALTVLAVVLRCFAVIAIPI